MAAPTTPLPRLCPGNYTQVLRASSRDLLLGDNQPLATNLDGPNNRTPTIWGSKCPLGSIFRGTNEEIEGLCPPGAL